MNFLRLTNLEIETFRETGFLKLGRILSGRDLEDLRAAYDHIIECLPSLRAGVDCLDVCLDDGYVWIHTPEMSESAFSDHPLRSYGREIAAQLLETDTSGWQSSLRLFHKPARKGRPTPLHQDEVYRNPGFLWRGISVWVTLDPATPESGAMRFVSGSHRLGVAPHHVVAEHESGGLGLEIDGASELAAVSVLTEVGEATAHDIRTVHGAHPNYSSRIRRAIVAVCDARGQAQPLSREPEPHAFSERRWFR